MKLSAVKNILTQLESLHFKLEDGTKVPVHFHITEVGMVTKHFIDCGGTVRTEKVANFQLWEANDFDHRLAPQKLLNIISLSEKTLGLEDLEVEVEYQTNTIGRYDLVFKDADFILKSKQTACLASDKCGIPAEKLKVNLSDLQADKSCCTPSGGCC